MPPVGINRVKWHLLFFFCLPRLPAACADAARGLCEQEQPHAEMLTEDVPVPVSTADPSSHLGEAAGPRDTAAALTDAEISCMVYPGIQMPLELPPTPGWRSCLQEL